MMKTIIRNLFSFILPVTVLLIVPWSIEDDFVISNAGIAVGGVLFIGGGLVILILTIRMFILIGKGTLAPWDPTRELVVRSLYRYVRNPMILGVFTVLIGESLLFSSRSIAIWASVFFIINTIYFILSEEPGLERRFGEEYREYKRNVPRWVPRITPWRPEG